MSHYMRLLPIAKRAVTNPGYYKTYGAYGGAVFLLAIYFAEWKTVGQFIPVWNRRYPKNE